MAKAPRSTGRRTKRKRTFGKVKRGRPTARRSLFKKRTGRSVGRSRIVMYGNLVQPKVRTRMVYVDTKTIQPTTGRAFHDFRLNNIFDPDATGIGHKPAYHDQWAVLYDTYRVTAVRVSVVMQQINTPGSTGHRLHTTTLEPGGYPFVIPNAVGQQHIVFMEATDADAILDDAVDLNFLRETGKRRKNYDWRYLIGRTKMTKTYKLANIMANLESIHKSTAFNASPTDAVILRVGAMSKDGFEMADVRFDIRLVYHVEMSNPKEISGS